MMRKIFVLFLIIFMCSTLVRGYPYDPIGSVEDTTVPLDPIVVNTTKPYQMKVPSGDQLHLLFHFNGTEGTGSFTFALFQVENATVPDLPNFPEYEKLIDEGGDIELKSVNFTQKVRLSSRYLSSNNSSLQLVTVDSGETLDGIAFDTFYEASIGKRQLYPVPLVNENKSEALLAIYFEGQGEGRINFIDYHLDWSLVLRGGDEFDTSTFASPWPVFPSLVFFIALVRRRRMTQ
ncbi:MAG: hypothetical protein D6732_21950 [Methanobacteriota archaeon]|nr:MAG: hypothetical protein D6732_21950 [Euryarchaeota archaeon]